MFFALRSTQIDDTTSESNLINDIPKKKIENIDSSVSRADYEFLDCGDLKRLERFAGTIWVMGEITPWAKYPFFVFTY